MLNLNMVNNDISRAIKNRLIIFRGIPVEKDGKTIEKLREHGWNSEFIYGGFAEDSDHKKYIVSQELSDSTGLFGVEIKPETLQRCTGFEDDETDSYIYEDDMLLVEGDTSKEGSWTGIVEFDNGMFVVRSQNEVVSLFDLKKQRLATTTVIGNAMIDVKAALLLKVNDAIAKYNDVYDFSNRECELFNALLLTQKYLEGDNNK